MLTAKEAHDIALRKHQMLTLEEYRKSYTNEEWARIEAINVLIQSAAEQGNTTVSTTLLFFPYSRECGYFRWLGYQLRDESPPKEGCIIIWG